MSDQSVLKQTSASAVSETLSVRGVLPEAPMAMPAQLLERPARGLFSWLSFRQTSRGV